MKEKKVWFKDKQGNKLCGVLHTPEGKGPFPAVVLAHGLHSNKDRPSYTGPAKVLEKEKIAVMRIDLYGHGESEGLFEDATLTTAINSISAAVKYLKALPNISKIGLFGCSYGGAASFYVATKTPIVEALVLRSSSADILEEWNSFLTKESIALWKKQGKMTIGRHNHTLKYSMYADLVKNNNKPFEELSKITIPTLVIHGEKDESIPLEQARKAYNALSGTKRMDVIKGAGHVIRDPDFLNKITDLAVEWFNKYLK